MTDATESIGKSLRIQLRVIGALLQREVITRYGRHNVGFLWLFIEPMLFTLGVTTVWYFLKANHGSNLPIVAFAITGYSSLLLWRNSSNRAVKAVEVNLSLMYHRNVKCLDVLLARVILEVLGATTSIIVLTIVFWAMGYMNLPSDLLIASVGWILLAWFSLSLSLIVGAISERSEMIERVWHIATYLMFPLSGAAFMIDWLPQGAKEFLLWVPMVHGTEMVRHGYFGNTVPTYENPSYLIIVNLAMTFVGLILVRETSMRVQPE